MAASLCLYVYGLLCNDLFDLEEDRRERPERPLPAGRAGVRAVGLVAAGCAAAGLALAASGGRVAQFVGLALAGAVLLYDSWFKRLRVIGALNMGLCRGLSVMLGAAFGGAFSPRVLAAAGVTTLYVAAVTNLARHETADVPSPLTKSLPFLSLLIPAFVFPFASIPFFVAAAVAVGLVTCRLFRGAPIAPAIGSMIRALLPLQAAFCAGSHHGRTGFGVAVALLALWPVSRLVGRRFYAS